MFDVSATQRAAAVGVWSSPVFRAEVSAHLDAYNAAHAAYTEYTTKATAARNAYIEKSGAQTVREHRRAALEWYDSTDNSEELSLHTAEINAKQALFELVFSVALPNWKDLFLLSIRKEAVNAKAFELVHAIAAGKSF